MWFSIAFVIGAVVMVIRLLDKQGLINWGLILGELKSIISGIKYYTLRTTLTSQPDSLLGTMFQDRNEALLHPISGNEYFIDRNGLAFHYILEYYRTGKILWPKNNNSSSVAKDMITTEELQQEFDYFQIPSTFTDLSQAHKSAASLLDEFITSLKDSAYEPISRFHTGIELIFYRDGSIPSIIPKFDLPSISSIQWRFKLEGFQMLELFGEEIEFHMRAALTDFNFKISPVSAYDGSKNIAGWRITMSTKPLDKLSVLGNSCLVQDKII
ncbi:3236_t:CDS:2 [Ambispora leptoticha]|uniref:3236_t:CDS:1 n=1 Tax=Ambispora leptoticha TaxID=144679 RepID=A0A9N9APD2_9GLOM|nr:3236_t:CDS:2 [Ambispora leptoticha]